MRRLLAQLVLAGLAVLAAALAASCGHLKNPAVPLTSGSIATPPARADSVICG